MKDQPTPRLLLSIDYEPWAAMLQDEFNHASGDARCQVDDGYSLSSLGELLDILGGAPVTIFLVGELVEWYPDIPERIMAKGHELGFHGQIHRPLTEVAELEYDLKRSNAWREKFHVRGYRAPIIGIPRAAYPMLDRYGFNYSSSVYAPTGEVRILDGISEIPVSTWPIITRRTEWWWPRSLSPRLLSKGEFPYGSSFLIGALGESTTIPFVEREMKAGRSPVLVLHNYQLVPPPGWPRQISPLLRRDPLQRAFVPSRQRLVERLLKDFPVGRIDLWLEELNSPLMESPHD